MKKAPRWMEQQAMTMTDVFLIGFQHYVEGSGDDDRPTSKGWMRCPGGYQRFGLDFSDGTRMVGPPLAEVRMIAVGGAFVKRSDFDKCPEFQAFSVE